MQGIINNLKHSYSAHSQTNHQSQGNHRMRSLSKRSQDSFNGDVRRLPRTQYSMKRKKSFMDFSDSLGLTNHNTVENFKRTPILWLSNDLKKKVNTIQQSRILARTAATNKFMSPCIVRPEQLSIKPKQNNTNELWKLRINDIFFCVQCFRYVFRIEFDYHYPSCKDPVSTQKLSKKEKREIGISKLRLLKQLIDMLKKSEQARLLQRIQQIKQSTARIKQLILPRKGSFYLIDDIESVIELIGINFFN